MSLLVVQDDVGDAADQRLRRANESGTDVGQFRADASHHQVAMFRRIGVVATQTLGAHQHIVHQQFHPVNQSKSIFVHCKKKKKRKEKKSFDLLASGAEDDNIMEESVVEGFLGRDGHHLARSQAALQLPRPDG